jgi:hypothetical protein
MREQRLGEGERDYSDDASSGEDARAASRARAGIVPALATFVAGCVLALVIAHWVWQIAAPAPRHLVAPAPADPVATIIAAGLFDSVDTAATSNGERGAVLSGDARLLGIIAAPGQQGYALFRLPAGAKLVAQGQEIAPGVTLEAIEPLVVTIHDGAGVRRIALPENTTAKDSATQTSMRSAASPAPVGRTTRTARNGGCAPPAGFHGNVVRLNAELLGGLAGDAGPWRTLLAPSAGGLVVRDERGFGAMLGLKSGDRIMQANGIALQVPDDVPSAVIRPLIANQGVRIVGSRAGTTRELWLANTACAG